MLLMSTHCCTSVYNLGKNKTDLNPHSSFNLIEKYLAQSINNWLIFHRSVAQEAILILKVTKHFNSSEEVPI